MSDSRFVKVYIPPRFRARIATFILLLWLFAAFTGVAFTIGPLVIGRKITQWLSKSDLPPNDIYAYTIGIHLTAFVAYAVVNTKIAILRLKNGTVRRFNDYHVLAARAKHGLGLMYLGLFTTVVLPTILALITELYIHMPLFILFGSRHHTEHTATTDTVQVQSPTIFILQTWTIGLFYLRLALRLILSYLAPQSRAAVAIRAIVRDGILRPDVPLASRAFVLPATVICSMLIVAPLFCARVWISLLGVVDAGMQMFIYRLAYPGLLGLGAVLYSFWAAQRQLASWRMKIRDEVYLIGERLHNFHEKAPEKELVRTGKQKAL
jgi:E3 ubiquitin-protein ligase MARCH6